MSPSCRPTLKSSKIAYILECPSQKTKNMKDFCIFMTGRFILENFIKIKSMAKVLKYISEMRQSIRAHSKKDRKRASSGSKNHRKITLGF